MKKTFLKIVALMSLLVIFLFAGCGCDSCGCGSSGCGCDSCGTNYSYSETFGISETGCGCASTRIKANYGTERKFNATFIKGEFFMNCHKDADGYVDSFTYEVEVKGFGDDLAYSGCSVKVTLTYMFIDYNGRANKDFSTITIVLNGRGNGKQSNIIPVDAMDVKVVKVDYEYYGTVTNI